MNDILEYKGIKRLQNHFVAILISKIGKKVPVQEPFYISDTCYFAGMTIVHPYNCQCDEEYERLRDAK
jgi:hypothetical protein